MDAQPELALLARVLHEQSLDAILIGNMAAALHRAPVTTVDIDFFFRKTPRNLKKLKAVARSLGAVILRPYYPVSDLFRLQRESDGLQLDFMGWIDGVSSYESLQRRASTFQIGRYSLLVSALRDIIRSKRAADRDKDRAVLDVLDQAAHERPKVRKTSPARRRSAVARALAKESEHALIELIRYRLALPPEKRLNCLRKKIGLVATAL